MEGCGWQQRSTGQRATENGRRGDENGTRERVTDTGRLVAAAPWASAAELGLVDAAEGRRG
jgi:hypothetical protein